MDKKDVVYLYNGILLSYIKEPIREKNLKKKDIYVCITESLCCTSETKTTLCINYTSIKKCKKRKDIKHF